MANRDPSTPAANESHANGVSASGGKSSHRAEDGHLKSRVIKRSLVVGGHKTSVSLEDVFWNALRAIAHDRRVHLSQLVGRIDADRQHCNLSSAIRLFVFEIRCQQSANAKLPDGTFPELVDSNVRRQT